MGHRGRDVAMIFQDPMMTLNPVLRIDTQMIEAITAHEQVSQRAARARALQALEAVGIASAIAIVYFFERSHHAPQFVTSSA